MDVPYRTFGRNKSPRKRRTPPLSDHLAHNGERWKSGPWAIANLFYPCFPSIRLHGLCLGFRPWKLCPRDSSPDADPNWTYEQHHVAQPNSVECTSILLYLRNMNMCVEMLDVASIPLAPVETWWYTYWIKIQIERSWVQVETINYPGLKGRIPVPLFSHLDLDIEWYLASSNPLEEISSDIMNPFGTCA